MEKLTGEYSSQDKQIKNLAALLEKIKKRPEEKKTCGMKLPKGSKGWRCKTCLHKDSAVFCTDCFEMSDHKGHKFEEIVLNGGFCDCGDPSFWDQNHFCELHGGPAYIPTAAKPEKNMCG